MSYKFLRSSPTFKSILTSDVAMSHSGDIDCLKLLYIIVSH